VLEVEHGKYAVGYKNITINDQFFPGHFPQRAIMPGTQAKAADTDLPVHCDSGFCPA
jgi:3-hydroxymyristoyl/3-hydroxydecanoyl-(acyl carrier protein) dehydratase